MNYAEATKAYRKVGAARAEGEAKLAMYASTVPISAALNQNTAPKFYEALRKAECDPLVLLKRWHDHPFEALDVAFAD